MARRVRSTAFLLRVPADLHRALHRAAAEAGISLNEYCLRRLSVSGAGGGVDPHATRVVLRAAAVAGRSLAGVILYGSWARQETSASSDVDVLIVVDRALELTRALYRSWDAEPVTWDGRAVDPHFVHLPAAGSSGVWGEAAIDGVVLFEAGLQVSSALAAVRRDIAAGRLVRRTLHGQPYWVAA